MAISERGTVIENVEDDPGCSTSTWSSTSMIRSPTNSSAGSAAASVKAARDSIGTWEMKG